MTCEGIMKALPHAINSMGTLKQRMYVQINCYILVAGESLKWHSVWAYKEDPAAVVVVWNVCF